MIGLYILIAIAITIAVLFVQYLVARNFADLAVDKGYAESKYFWFCFLLGLPGYLMVIAMPDYSKHEPAVSSALPEL